MGQEWFDCPQQRPRPDDEGRVFRTNSDSSSGYSRPRPSLKPHQTGPARVIYIYCKQVVTLLAPWALFWYSHYFPVQFFYEHIQS